MHEQFILQTLVTAGGTSILKACIYDSILVARLESARGQSLLLLIEREGTEWW
jgi:hypothetical protein